MPGQRKLMVTLTSRFYDETREETILYTCDWWELRDGWVVMYNVFDNGTRHKTLSLSNATRVEER